MDENAFYRKWWPIVVKFLTGSCGASFEDAEESVSDVFIELKKKDEINDLSIEKVLFTRAKRNLLDIWRKNRRRDARHRKLEQTGEMPSSPTAPDTAAIQAEDAQLYREMLSCLNSDEKMVVTKREEGATNKQIATELGITDSGASHIYSRAIIKMREMRARLLKRKTSHE